MTHWRRLILGKTEGKRRSRQQRMRLLDSITNSMDKSLSKLWEIVKDRKPGVLYSPWGCKGSGTTEPMNNNNRQYTLM